MSIYTILTPPAGIQAVYVPLQVLLPKLKCVWCVCWVLSLVGTGDNSPLSKDPIPTGGDPDRSAGRPLDYRETGQEQAENQSPLETAEKLARDLKAVKYVECSALTQVKRTVHYTLKHTYNKCIYKHIYTMQCSLARTNKVEERGCCPLTCRPSVDRLVLIGHFVTLGLLVSNLLWWS